MHNASLFCTRNSINNKVKIIVDTQLRSRIKIKKNIFIDDTNKLHILL